jgi:hypothetical protein
MYAGLRQYGYIGASRLYAEMELDCFFAQIIGAKDSLLMRINEKLGLGVDDKVVNLDEVYNRLKSQDKEYIVKELKTLKSKR